MITLFNPTKDELKGQHAGANHLFRPGEVVEKSDPDGNHILNQLFRRGLCRLKFGDDKDAVAKEGIARANEFKKKMVMDHNAINFQRSQAGWSLLPPSEDVRRFAAELGLILETPRVQKINEDTDSIGFLKQKNTELTLKLQELMQTVTNMASGQAEQKALAKPSPEERIASAKG